MALALYGFKSCKRRIEPAGISYEFSVVKDKLTLGLSPYPVLRIDNIAKKNSEDALGEPAEWMDKDDNKYRKYIARLDPNNIKEQDHYKVLGLSKLRFQASQAQIKTAYRQKVLIYHPDKGRGQDGSLRNEAVFTCIQKAYEQLGLSEEKRRAFDSIDPTFDETTPTEVSSEFFFIVLGPVFERNARFSINQPVPLLGDKDSDRSHIEHFYEFWYNWQSWRDFSYLDKEDKTKGEDRWERREIEKQNKLEREKRRKKDLKRISSLVELTYSRDPRVIKFKEEDKRRKEAQKEERRKEREQREHLEAEVRRRAEKAVEDEQKIIKEAEREATKLKQQQRKAISAQRKRLRDISAAANYWARDSHQFTMAIMEQIERICLFADYDQIKALSDQLADTKLPEDAQRLLVECARQDTDQVQKKACDSLENTNCDSKANKLWAASELQLLVKAVNLYPPGTQERWKQVAEYVSYHGGEQRNERDVIKQVKLLKSDPTSNSVGAAQIKSVATTENDESIVGAAKAMTLKGPSKNEGLKTAEGWNADQQKQLEMALKETAADDTERWEKIATKVDGKSKKDCMRRYKALREAIKAKAGAQKE